MWVFILFLYYFILLIKLHSGMSSAGRKEDCNPGLLLTLEYMTCDDGGYWVVTYYYLVSCIKFVSWLSFERRIQGNAICEPHPPALFCPAGMWWRGEGWELFGKKWDFLKIILHREFLSMKWPVQWTGHNPITNTHSRSLSSLCVLGWGVEGDFLCGLKIATELPWTFELIHLSHCLDSLLMLQWRTTYNYTSHPLLCSVHHPACASI